MKNNLSLTYKVALVINILLVLFFSACALGFLLWQSLYGAFWALISLAIAVTLLKKIRWGYFAAAAWGLAVFQLTKQGMEFENYKHQAMTIGFFLIPLAVFLHEVLVKNAPTSRENDESDRQS